MAFGSNTIWEIRLTGNDNNGGGFDPTATGFATDLTATSGTGNSPVVSSASYTFVAGDQGAWLFVKSGTNWLPGMYQIASVSAGAATLSAAIGQGIAYSGTMPVAFTAVAGVASVASPTTGTWGIDYSQQDSPRTVFTDMVIDAVTNSRFTSVLNPAGKNMVGNIINITSGTGFTLVRAEIQSTTGLTIQCDRSLGTVASIGGNSNLGGAIFSFGISAVVSLVNTQMLHFVKYNASPYLATSASTNIASGCMAPGTTNYWNGYDTSRFIYSLDANRPTFKVDSGVSAATLVTTTNSPNFWNINLDGGGQTTSAAWNTRGVMAFCKVSNFTAASVCINNNGTGYYWGCEGTLNSGIAFTGKSYYGWCHDNTVTPFLGGANDTMNFCIATNNTGASTDGFNNGIGTNWCIAYGNGRDGFRIAPSGGGTLSMYTNCISQGNGGYGYNAQVGTRAILNTSASFNNTSGRSLSSTSTVALNDINPIIGSASFFTNAATGDFTTNNTAGGGALIRGLGWPPIFPNIGLASYPDVGALQHQDTGGGGITGGSYIFGG